MVVQKVQGVQGVLEVLEVLDEISQPILVHDGPRCACGASNLMTQLEALPEVLAADLALSRLANISALIC